MTDAYIRQWVDLIEKTRLIINESFTDKSKSQLDVWMDVQIAHEVAQKICTDFERYTQGKIQPNMAKQAGTLVYWVRKLKPLYTTPRYTQNGKEQFDEDTQYKYLTVVNEHAALAMGFSVFGIKIEKGSDKETLLNYATLSPQIIRRWLHSLRYRPHSRESLISAFECFLCEPSDHSKSVPVPAAVAGQTLDYDKAIKKHFSEIQDADVIGSLNSLAAIIKEFDLPKQFSNPIYHHKLPSQNSSSSVSPETKQTMEPSPALHEKLFLWKLIRVAADRIDEIFETNTRINHLAVYDIIQKVSMRLNQIPLPRKDRMGKKQKPEPASPTITQLAGIAAYWIVRLKPCTMDQNNSKYIFSPLNELVAVLVGLAICAKYLDTHKKNTGIFSTRFMEALKKRLLFDMVISLRYKLSSVDSLALKFELLAQNQLIDPDYFNQMDEDFRKPKS